MKFYFLGTSSGIPTNYRNVSGLLFIPENSKHSYLFDCGEGTQHQLYKSPYSISKISDIFITHLHGDHFYGLLGFLSSKMLLNLKEPISIYAPKGIKKFIGESFAISNCKLNYPLNIYELKAGQVIKETKDFFIKAIPVEHNIDCYAFCIQDKEHHYRLDVNKVEEEKIPRGRLYAHLAEGKNIEYLGKKIFAKDFRILTNYARKIIICADNANPKSLSSYAEGLSLLIHEATHTEEVKKTLSFQSFHSTAKEVANFAESFKIKNLIFHHFSPRFSFSKKNNVNINQLIMEAKEFYRGKLFLARDFTGYKLNKKGEVYEEKSRNFQ